MSDTPSGPTEAEALATADRHFAQALCTIVSEMRQAGRADPEMIALELEFALRGCYWTGEGDADRRLRERAATLLEMAGGTTSLEIEYGTPAPPPKTGSTAKRIFG